jgi:hypothetical protein
MRIAFFNTENTPTPGEIRSIETRYNLSFPDDYVKHLLTYNGGECKPNIFEFTENQQVTESNIDWFLAVYDGEYDNLEDYIITYKVNEARIPDSFVPIAHDPGGNLICISCSDKRIYFWDHEKENITANHNQPENVYLIANSLPELFGILK